jgi:hypothetical protein
LADQLTYREQRDMNARLVTLTLMIGATGCAPSGTSSGSGSSSGSASPSGAECSYVALQPDGTHQVAFYKDCTWDVGRAESVGSCVIESSLLADAQPFPTAPSSISAGTITITGLVPGDNPLTLLPTPYEAGVAYASATSPLVKPIFEAGAPLAVLATGADVPAFAAQLVAPANVALVSPPADAATMIDTSTDLQIAWSGGASGESITIVFGANAGNVLCTFDSPLQTAVVPKEALAPLAGSQHGNIDVWGYAAASTMAGSTSVAFEVFTVTQTAAATYK